ncbi:germination lipoprotein GerS [Romboutsia lituseburensis]|uniref:Outer membrane lipoprotein-sorting protein n=1 Tax=Romboutsia lituseburensis DSM 797 TaxID=1121325 RepID=A0A1G9TSV0_9FIRM|nr:germination lipoprotein GerS [Romboutsia lituseburensis]CEH32694.1 DNA gyrase, subunit B [Romboutsia lituseburensis]SDM50796.1 Outer membrane lipoprotein-sorting protein [Romboutsia lituseburensis DSM 797]
MKKKWTILIIIVVGILSVFIGCQKRESTKEEVYTEFQKRISAMKSYKCSADVEVIGNKSAQNYTFIHTYNKPNNYKLEVVSPKHLKGKTIEYKQDKILVKNPDINDLIQLPNVGKNNQYMFIGDFIKNSLQNEEIDIRLSKGHLVLETYIPGEDEYFNKQVLYVNTENKNPEKMEILDKQGKSRFIVNYKNFEYKK